MTDQLVEHPAPFVTNTPSNGRGSAVPALRLRNATLAFGPRVLWQDLNLDIAAGQFVAVLGANGSGKTSLIKVLLGEQPLTGGAGWVMGAPITRGSTDVGYVPQRVAIDAMGMLKARDVVRMGLDGHRWGLPIFFGNARSRARAKLDEFLESVGATDFADAPVSMLSGGELQRIRVAEALASDPGVLLCDEPLAALDLRHQQEVAALIDAHRRQRENGGAVRHPRRQRRAGLRGPDLVSGGRVVPVRHPRRGVDLRNADRVVRGAGGRGPLAGPGHRRCFRRRAGCPPSFP